MKNYSLLKYNYTFLLLALFLLSAACSKPSDFPVYSERDLLLEKPAYLTFEPRVEEVTFRNLHMLGKVKRGGVYGQRTYGMILRSLRFQNITRKLEEKYQLPKNLLLAMVMQESGGVDLLPNSGDDGGIGLIHMQPQLAKQFGLKTYKNCEKLVCKKHGKALRRLIVAKKYDRKKLIKYDDRFNPVLNIDAAARMLLYYRSGKQVKSDPLKTAIYGYAGRYNYKKYYKNVIMYMKKLNNKKLINDIRKDFNSKNPKLTANGKRIDFDGYIKIHQKQNINYGLNEL